MPPVVPTFVPPSQPNKLSMLSLIPKSPRAHEVLAHPHNRRLISLVPYDKKLMQGINIGFHIATKSRYTLAVIGRRDCDVTIEGGDISTEQCAFEINKKTQWIMLSDRSRYHSTQITGPNAFSFESGRIPRRVILPQLPGSTLEIYGTAGNLVSFDIVWHSGSFNVEEMLELREDRTEYALTDDEPETTPVSQRVSRIDRPINSPTPRLRYLEQGAVGRGAFGQVEKVLNIDSGNRLVVKKIPYQGQSTDYLQREVIAMSKIEHAHIVEYVASQPCQFHFEIFMELKEGNLEDKVRATPLKDAPMFNILLHQMLSALDYLAHNGMVHRDVKPANILYKNAGNRTIFQLSDFGVCNLVGRATTAIGSQLYMAPEILQNQNVLQTSKVDIWSLFVTLADATNMGKFRERAFETNAELIAAVLESAKFAPPDFQWLRDMAVVEPKDRVPAAVLLWTHFGGEDATTKRNQMWDEPALAMDPSSIWGKETAMNWESAKGKQSEKEKVPDWDVFFRRQEKC